MKYCMECGTKLQSKPLENEGEVPFCPSCQQFRFPVFNVAVSVIVQNAAKDKVLLIEQYGRDYFILIAGYINKGECAEETIKREVYEEMGLEVTDICYNRSEYYPKSNTLLLNYSCVAPDESYTMNTKEVDNAAWFPFDTCRDHMKPGSLAERFLTSYLEKRQK